MAKRSINAFFGFFFSLSLYYIFFEFLAALPATQASAFFIGAFLADLLARESYSRVWSGSGQTRQILYFCFLVVLLACPISLLFPLEDILLHVVWLEAYFGFKFLLNALFFAFFLTPWFLLHHGLNQIHLQSFIAEILSLLLLILLRQSGYDLPTAFLFLLTATGVFVLGLGKPLPQIKVNFSSLQPQLFLLLCLIQLPLHLEPCFYLYFGTILLNRIQPLAGDGILGERVRFHLFVLFSAIFLFSWQGYLQPICLILFLLTLLPSSLFPLREFLLGILLLLGFSLLNPMKASQILALLYCIVLLDLLKLYIKEGPKGALKSLLLTLIFAYSILNLPNPPPPKKLPAPSLLTKGDLWQASFRGSLLYKSFFYESRFLPQNPDARYLMFNMKAPQNSGFSLFFLDKDVKEVSPDFYMQDFFSEEAKRTFALLMRNSSNLYLGFNFHRIFLPWQFLQWIDLLAPLSAGGFLVVTGSSVEPAMLNQFVLRLGKIWPDLRVELHEDLILLRSKMTTPLRKIYGIEWNPALTAQEFLERMQASGMNAFVLWEQLIEEQIRLKLQEISPNFEELRQLALYVFAHELHKATALVLQKLVELDSASELWPWAINQVRQKEDSSGSVNQAYASFCAAQNQIQDSYLVDWFALKTVFAFPHAGCSPNLLSTQELELRPWFALALMLEAAENQAAWKFYEEQKPIPVTGKEKVILRRLLEGRGMTREASIWLD